MKRLIAVTRKDLDEVWPQVEDWIVESLLHSQDELNASQVRMALTQGLMHLLVCYDTEQDKLLAACVVEVISYPNYRCANVVSFGGTAYFFSLADMAEFANACKQLGVSKIQGFVRPSVAVLLKRRGFKTAYEVVRFDLRT